MLCEGIYNNANIIINSSDVVLDCDGATLNGNGSGYGIYLENKSNVTIRNCNVINYEYGIYLDSSSNNSIINNTANLNNYGILQTQNEMLSL